MVTPEHSLRTAWSYVEEVEEKFPEFSDFARTRSDAASKSSTGFVDAFRGEYAVAKERVKLLGDISLAEKEISVAEARDRNVAIKVEKDGEELTVTPTMLRAACAADAGIIFAASGDPRQAEKRLRQALGIVQSPEWHYLLALILLDLKRPDEATASFRSAVDLDPDSQHGVEARKELGRLNAKRLFGKYWFVGSWKIAGVLLLFTVVSLVMIAQSESGGVLNLLLWGGLTALYLWKKLKSAREAES